MRFLRHLRKCRKLLPALNLLVAFEKHTQETQIHVSTLEQVFELTTTSGQRKGDRRRSNQGWRGIRK
jgi:ferritin-like metal-binding protein YciE